MQTFEEWLAKTENHGGTREEYDKLIALERRSERSGKSEDCEGCPLINEPGPVPSELNDRAAWDLEGNTDVLFVSEAPGRVEVETNRPFANPRGAGGILRQCLEQVGITKFGILNVWRCRPPANKLPEGEVPGKFCRDKFEEELTKFNQEITVALGGVGLNALTEHPMSIMKVRGRVFTVSYNGRQLLLMPMLHPAFLLRQRGWWRDWELDIEKLKRYLDDPKKGLDYIPLSERKVYQAKSTAEASAFVEKLRKHDVIACDIETTSFNMPWEGGVVISVAFAVSPTEAYAVPWRLVSQALKEKIKQLMEDRSKKWLWYNGSYDVQFFWAEGINARIDGDVMLEAHLLDERLNVHSLKKDAAVHLNQIDWEEGIKKYKIPNDTSQEAMDAWRNIPEDELLEYCFVHDTPILMSDLTWKPISEMGVGDSVIGVVHNLTLKGKFVSTQVVKTHKRDSETVRVSSNRSTLACTSGHPFFAGLGRDYSDLHYKPVSLLRDRQVKFFGIPPQDVSEFNRGWLAGYIDGDGYKSDGMSQGWRTTQCGADSVDLELIEHVVELACVFGFEFSGPSQNKNGLYQTYINKHAEFDRLLEFLWDGTETRDYRCGWLAGMFDAEGSKRTRGGFDIPQKLGEVCDRIVRYANELGYDVGTWQDPQTPDYQHNVVEEELRFLVECPSILERKKQLRRSIGVPGLEVKLSVEPNGVSRVCNLTTGTNNYIAAGFLVHNCGQDTTHTLHLSLVLREQLGTKLCKYADELLVPAYNMLARARNVGVRVDLYKVKELRDTFAPVLNELEHKLVEISGDTFFNPNSSQQKLALLRKRGLNVSNVQKDTLLMFEGDEAVDAMFAYSEAHKMYSTYVMGIADDISDDLRVHPDWRLPAETGRLRCSDPNMLGMPRKAEESEHKWKRRIKEMFVADSETLLAHIDRKQSEVRCACFLAGDEALTKILKSGRDLHSEMAKLMYGDEFTYEQRVLAKMVTFGLIYNREAPSLARQLGVSVREAQRVIDKFFSQMPRLLEWKEEMMQEALAEGELTSWFGRKRRFGLITWENKKDVKNEAVNFPPSSISSDLNLLSCIETMKQFGKYGVEVLVPIHDAGLLRIPKSSHSLIDEIKGMWEGLIPKILSTDLPFPVDVTVGERWSDL